MQDVGKRFFSKLNDALKGDALQIPTLPEVSLKIKAEAENPDTDTYRLASVVGKDAGISAKLIRMANGPLVRGSVPVNNLNNAIGRIGIQSVKNVAIGLAMQQMFQATSDVIDERMRKAWERSTEVAAFSQALAKTKTKLNPDVAGLAGLIHEIGILPILSLAEETSEILETPTELDKVIDQLHPIIGAEILKYWQFPDELLNVPTEVQNFQREVSRPDYANVVLVASLATGRPETNRFHSIDKHDVPAFNQLGIDPDENLLENEIFSENLSAAREVWC